MIEQNLLHRGSGDTQELEVTWSFFKPESQSSGWREWIALEVESFRPLSYSKRGWPSGVARGGRYAECWVFRVSCMRTTQAHILPRLGGNRLRGSGRSGISVRVLLVLVQAQSQRRRGEKQYEGSVMSRASGTVGETLGLV